MGGSWRLTGGEGREGREGEEEQSVFLTIFERPSDDFF